MKKFLTSFAVIVALIAVFAFAPPKTQARIYISFAPTNATIDNSTVQIPNADIVCSAMIFRDINDYAPVNFAAGISENLNSQIIGNKFLPIRRTRFNLRTSWRSNYEPPFTRLNAFKNRNIPRSDYFGFRLII